jgi:glutamine amidotransferase
MITIVDYGMGNMGSMLNMFKRIGVKACVASAPEAIGQAEKLVLPGVGAFDAAMQRINNTPKLRNELDRKVLRDRVPVLGVCLGMQLLTRGSEEGELPGLGWIPADTTRFPKVNGLKVPHMGWNVARPNKSNVLTATLGSEPRYYFVHSYCVHVDNPMHSLMRTHYGIDFDSAICMENIYGLQFHPEKSHRFGMKILENFAGL